MSYQTDIQKLVEVFAISELDDEGNEIRTIVNENIAQLQAENCKTFNKKRVQTPVYKLNELVAIKRTHFGIVIKLKPKYFGPYKIEKYWNMNVMQLKW